jgi:glycosyltransferase involved in cell wall biosynthesis
MNKVSVVIITLNEENNIKGCLESVKWADEIIVVDSGSQDKTVEICRQYTDFVYDILWQGFGKQKNSAVDLAHFDWILSIDADERVTPELKEEIGELLKEELKCSGYFISRKSYFGKRLILHCGWFPDFTIRLFNRKKGRFNDVQVHESVQISGNLGYLRHSLIHFTYKNISDFLIRMNRYSTLAANDLFKEKKKGAVLKMIFRPPATFLKMYLLKGGYKEGFPGMILSGLYAFYTFVKYSKLWELNKNAKT